MGYTILEPQSRILAGVLVQIRGVTSVSLSFHSFENFLITVVVKNK